MKEKKGFEAATVASVYESGVLACESARSSSQVNARSGQVKNHQQPYGALWLAFGTGQLVVFTLCYVFLKPNKVFRTKSRSSKTAHTTTSMISLPFVAGHFFFLWKRQNVSDLSICWTKFRNVVAHFPTKGGLPPADINRRKYGSCNVGVIQSRYHLQFHQERGKEKIVFYIVSLGDFRSGPNGLDH